MSDMFGAPETLALTLANYILGRQILGDLYRLFVAENTKNPFPAAKNRCRPGNNTFLS